MTHNEDDIDAGKNNKKIHGPLEKQAILPPQPFTESEMAIQVRGAITPYVPQQNKENVCAEIVPFEANFDQDEISDMDILSAICGLTANVTTTTSVANTSNTNNVLSILPKAMFANCQIGSINNNFNKK